MADTKKTKVFRRAFGYKTEKGTAVRQPATITTVNKKVDGGVSNVGKPSHLSSALHGVVVGTYGAQFGAELFGNKAIDFIREERRSLVWGIREDKNELAEMKSSFSYAIGSKRKRRKAKSLEERIGVAEVRLRDIEAELEFEIQKTKQRSVVGEEIAPEVSSESTEASQPLSLQDQLESVTGERQRNEELRKVMLGRAEMFADRVSSVSEDVTKHIGKTFKISDVDVQMDPNSLRGKRLEGVTSRSRFAPREGSLLRASLSGKATLGSGDDAITLDVKATYDGEYSDRHSPDAWNRPADYGEIRPIDNPIEYSYEGKQITSVDELLQLVKSKKK